MKPKSQNSNWIPVPQEMVAERMVKKWLYHSQAYKVDPGEINGFTF